MVAARAGKRRGLRRRRCWQVAGRVSSDLRGRGRQKRDSTSGPCVLRPRLVEMLGCAGKLKRAMMLHGTGSRGEGRLGRSDSGQEAKQTAMERGLCTRRDPRPHVIQPRDSRDAASSGVLRKVMMISHTSRASRRFPSGESQARRVFFVRERLPHDHDEVVPTRSSGKRKRRSPFQIEVLIDAGCEGTRLDWIARSSAGRISCRGFKQRTTVTFHSRDRGRRTKVRRTCT